MWIMKHNDFHISFLIFLIGCLVHRGSGFGRNIYADEAYEKVNLRRTRSHSPPSDDSDPAAALRGSKVDSALLDTMGSADLATGNVDRRRRDEAEANFHAKRAESDAIAAAAESAAAEADAVAAAVEATEVEASRRDSGGSHQYAGGGQQYASGGAHQYASSSYGDNSMTFEESDDGNNMVVVEQDLREKEHGGIASSRTSEFDVSGSSSSGGGSQDSHSSSYQSRESSNSGVSVGDASMDSRIESQSGRSDGIAGDASATSMDSSFQSQEGGRGSGWRGGSFSSSSVSESKNIVNTGGGSGEYADVQQPLNALLSESTDLAKEVRLIFQVLARREDYLVQEMEKLKLALQKAIQDLEANNKEARIIRRRRENDQDTNPYRACVYINPPPAQKLQPLPPLPPPPPPPTNYISPPASLLQNPPPTYDYDYSSSYSSQSSSGNSEEVDLSSVYWLKLPQDEDEGILEKVHNVLSGVRNSGKDVLFIPVSRGYMSNEDVAKGFLRAVRVKPAYVTQLDSNRRRLRKKLRLRILRI